MTDLIPFGRRSRRPRRAGFVDEFHNMLDDFFTSALPQGRWGRDAIPVDIRDQGDHYLVEADVPGVRRENIRLALRDERLTIAINEEEDIEEEEEGYIHKERRYASMSRSVYLSEAQSEGVKAKLEDGVLKITVPKASEPEEIIEIDVE